MSHDKLLIPSAEVKASSPIRTSLYEREGSMWGSLKRPSPRRQGNLVADCRSDDSDFCLLMTSRYGLSKAQMHRAADRYRLGKSRSGKCIFWMMDDMGQVRDGHIGTSWVSMMLKAREPEFLRYWHASHCLFGLHLLGMAAVQHCGEAARPVCIVEREPTAVVLSELFPECLWMASAYPLNLNTQHLEPLRSHRVTLYPPTDPAADNYFGWLEVADEARRILQLDVSVSTILEDHASREQKQRGIDLLDFLIESGQKST